MTKPTQPSRIPPPGRRTLAVVLPIVLYFSSAAAHKDSTLLPNYPRGDKP